MYFLQHQFLWFSPSFCQSMSQFYSVLIVLCWMEDPWLPTVLSMLEDVCFQCPIAKDLILGVSVDQVLKALLLLHLTLWLLRVCVAHIRAFFLNMSGVYSKGLPAVYENCHIGVLERAFQTILFLPWLIFYFLYLGLDWLSVPVGFNILLFGIFGMASSSQAFESSCHLCLHVILLFGVSIYM